MPVIDSREAERQEAESIKEELPKTIEFSGQKLIIYTDSPSLILFDENQAGAVKSALQTRNDFVEDNYQITLDVRSVDADAVETELLQSIESGTTSAHLLCYPASVCAKLYALGYLTDLISLPNFDAKAIGYEDYASRSVSFGGKIYLLPTDSLPYYDDIYCVFYRKDLVEQAGLREPELLVMRKEWTFDAFRQYTESVASGVMNKSSYDKAQDTFGYSGRDQKDLSSILAQAAGIDPIGKDGSGQIVLSSSAEQLEQQSSNLKSLMKSKSRAPYYGSGAVDAFLAGRLGFYIDHISFIDVLYERKMETEGAFDYGVLPLPAGESGFVSPVDSEIHVYCVPTSTPGRDLSGLGLTALCGAGRITVKQSAIDSYLTLFSFDNEQSCMLDTILRSASIRFGHLYEGGFDPVYDCFSGLFYSYFDKGSSYDSLLKSRKEAFDECIASNFS